MPTSTPVPTDGPLAAPVVARTEIPFPDAQTVGPDAIAVLGDSIWIADDGQTHLVRIDARTHAVLAVIEVEPTSLFAGDGALWTLSPVGGVPGPDRLTVGMVDLDKNIVVRTNYPQVEAAGLGALWGVSRDGGLVSVSRDNGEVTGRWPAVRGNSVQVACGTVWVDDGESLTRVDPETGEPTTAIDISQGGGPVHETSTGCTVVTYDMQGNGSVIEVVGSDVQSQSPPIEVGVVETSLDPIQMAGDTVWTSTDGRSIQQIDPVTASPIGSPWLLPPGDIPTKPKFIDWRLISAEGDLWLLTGQALTHLDISTGP